MVCSYWFPPDEVRTSAPIGIEDVEGRFGNVRGEETMKCLKRTSDLGSGRRLLRVLCEDMNISIPVRGSGSGNIIAGDKKDKKKEKVRNMLDEQACHGASFLNKTLYGNPTWYYW
ncbi:hypothetical protein QQ045_030434 [Rhodiola kirilowii]